MSRRGQGGPPITLFSFQDIITSVTAVIILITLMLCVDLIQRRKTSAPEAPRPTAAQQEEIARLEREVAEMEAAVQARQTSSQVLVENPRKLRADCEDRRRQLTQTEAELQTLQARLAALRATPSVVAQPAAALEARRSAVEARRAAVTRRAEADHARQQLARIQRDNRLIFNQAPGEGKRAWLVDLRGDAIVVTKTGQPEPIQRFQGKRSASASSAFLNWVTNRNRASEYFVLLVRPDSVSTFDTLRADLRTRGFDIGFDLIAADAEIAGALAEDGK